MEGRYVPGRNDVILARHHDGRAVSYVYATAVVRDRRVAAWRSPATDRDHAGLAPRADLTPPAPGTTAPLATRYGIPDEARRGPGSAHGQPWDKRRG